MTLSAYFAQHPKAALGFSGGVDSSYLLYAARQAGCSIRPYFIKTPPLAIPEATSIQGCLPSFRRSRS